MRDFSHKPVTFTLMMAKGEPDLSQVVLKCQLDKLSSEIFLIDLKQSKSGKSDIIAGHNRHKIKLELEKA